MEETLNTELNQNSTILSIGNEINVRNNNLTLNSLIVYPFKKKNILGYITTGLIMPFASYIFGSFIFPKVTNNISKMIIVYFQILVSMSHLGMDFYTKCKRLL